MEAQAVRMVKPIAESSYGRDRGSIWQCRSPLWKWKMWVMVRHQAQVINYLTVAELPIGLLINFRRRKLEYKRLRNRESIGFNEELAEEKLPF